MMQGSVLLLVSVLCVCATGETDRYRRRPNARPMWFAQGVPDRVYFQGQRPDESKKLSTGPTEIPLDLIMEFNNAYNLTDFLNNFVDSESFKNVTGQDILSNRFGDDDERKAVQMAKPAACIPELTVVSLMGSNNFSLFYYPSCTRIERCGGCCSHSLLSCQPSDSEMVNFQVYVTEYTGNKQMKLRGKEIVSVERHTKCTCDCIVQEKDCNQLQEYFKKECRCKCLNLDEENKCRAENDTKLWDPKSCSCGCRETRECSTGFYFDQNECSCVPTLTRIRSALQTRRRRGDNIDGSQ